MLKCQRIHRLIFILSTAVLGTCPTLANAAIVLSNATTQVVVNGGEANNGLIPYDGYFRYTDLGESEETTWSIDPLLRFADGSTSVLSNGLAGGFGSPISSAGGALSTGTTGGVTVEALTELFGSNARTTFTFSSATSLDGTTFIFYAENDIFTFGDDAAVFTGSIFGADLELFMFDSVSGGLSVKMTGEEGSGSTLTLFGAGIWTGWGTALESGDLSVLSADGSNFATLGDLGIALAFSLTGTSATLVINYDTQPDPPTAIDGPAIPKTFALYQSVPNPFNPTTSIGYDVADGGGVVTLRIYDVSGRLIRTLVEGVQSPGQKSTTWNGRDDRGSRVATGVYFYRLTAPGFSQTRKMLLLK